MKKLAKDLLKDIEHKVYGDLSGLEIDSITHDSRKVEKGSLFVAMKGFTVDGHKYVQRAINAGCVAVIGEDDTKGLSIPYIQVRDSRVALGKVASAFYDSPSKKLKVIGVTGTDGKTTTVNLIYHLLRSAGEKVGMVSTINAKIGKKELDTGLHVTTPGAVDLHKYLHMMVEEGCEYGVLEVTSHGIDQGRVEGVEFSTTVLTNITHEHLDMHGSWDDYRDIKVNFLCSAKDLVVLNRDDETFSHIKHLLRSGIDSTTYSAKDKSADFLADAIVMDDEGSSYEVRSDDGLFKVKTNLVAEYNVSNALAAIVVSESFGLNDSEIAGALLNVPKFTGRMEEVENDKDFRTIVDFAHTPNSIELVLKTLRDQLDEGGRLIVVFGSAGRRDVEKRKMMPVLSVKIADVSIFTAEDPRDEGVSAILGMMEEAAMGAGGVKLDENHYRHTVYGSKQYYISIPERGKAISFAIQKLARKGDIVVVLGKGHEKSMCYGTTEYPWSDREAVEMALAGGTKTLNRDG